MYHVEIEGIHATVETESPIEAIKWFLAIGIDCEPEDITATPVRGRPGWWKFSYGRLTFCYDLDQVATREAAR